MTGLRNMLRMLPEGALTIAIIMLLALMVMFSLIWFKKANGERYSILSMVALATLIITAWIAPL